MSDELERSKVLVKEIESATRQLDLKSSEAEFEDLKSRSLKSDFWNDTMAAQEIMKRIAKLETRITAWRELENSAKEIQELLSLEDESLLTDLEKQLSELERKFENLKRQLKFSGQYDDHDVILNIYAGAGGTDAQDWAQMLLRMYVRYAENAGFQSKTVEESAGEEAGIKSATVEISGDFAYGKLQGEHGVHRLVRLSPYNSDNLRQTSFARVEILPKIDAPDEVDIDESDLKIDVYRSGGHGGQSVNTTDSAVRVTHVPTGIVVAIQNERSQLQNKDTALTILRSRLAQMQMEQHAEKIDELKGPVQSAEWGNQIRSYVLHPYKQVKDLRTKFEVSDPDSVLDGGLDGFIDAYLETNLGK